MGNIQNKRLKMLVRSLSGAWTDEDKERTRKDLEGFDGEEIAKHFFREKHMRRFRCCICGCDFWDYTGCNPAPIVNDENAVCCHRCDTFFVIPARIGEAPGSFIFPLANM